MLSFSHSGKFVCDIAQKGSGPEEYTMLMNLLYINNRVLITDLNNKVNVYSLNGKFIESIRHFGHVFCHLSNVGQELYRF